MRQMFFHMVGGKTSFLLLVCILKMLRISSGIEICVQNIKRFLIRDLPHPVPWLLGPDPSEDMCVQNDQCDNACCLPNLTGFLAVYNATC